MVSDDGETPSEIGKDKSVLGGDWRSRVGGFGQMLNSWWKRIRATAEADMEGLTISRREQEYRRKQLYDHRRDMLLEDLRLRRWLDGHEYEEDPPR